MRGLFHRIELLSKDEIKSIHDTSLSILENVGFRVPHEEMLYLLKDAGADVDHKSHVARVPPNLIVECVARIPKTYTIEPADKEKSIMVNDGKIKGCMENQPVIIDYLTKTMRPGVTDDILRAIAIADSEGMRNICRLASFVVPSDIPIPLQDIYTYKILATYCRKPFDVNQNSVTSTHYMIEIAKVLAGGEEELRRRKILGYGANPISPLQFSRHTLDIMMEMAKYCLPIGIAPMVMAGGTAPVTLAGALVLENAEFLMGAILVNLLNREQPLSYGGIPHVFDLRTGLCSFGSPEQALLSMAIIQVARSYGFACGVNVGLTDSHMPDFQGGFEKGMTAALGVAAGAEGIGMQGLVDTRGVSLEQLIIDNEWIDDLNRVFRGFEVNEETLALDTIIEVGIGGSFMGQRHTVEHGRDEQWVPEIFNRDYWPRWLNLGGKDTCAKAHEKVESLLKDNYPPQPVLDKDLMKDLDNIYERAEKEIIHNS